MTEPPSHLTPTDGFAGHATGLRAIRSAFRAATAISPDVAARAAEALFFKTSRPKPRPEEAAFLATARRFTVAAAGQQIAGYHWGDRGPVVLCAHGWWSHAGRFTPLARALRAADFQVVALDAAAHGRSTGWRSSMPEFALSIRAVADQVGALHAVVGHSLGGSAALFAISRGLQTTRAVTIASPADLARWAEEFRVLMSLSDAVYARMVRNMEQRLGLVWADLDVTSAAGRLDIPGLVIQDRHDPDVPAAEGVALAAAWPRAELLLTENLGHRAIVRDPEVMARIVEFMRR
ncbi:MAG: alpha/beta hydrolase [Gemmatimonadota bacterium]